MSLPQHRQSKSRSTLALAAWLRALAAWFVVAHVSLLASSAVADGRALAAGSGSAKGRPECATANATIEPKRKAIAAEAPGIEKERKSITDSEQALAAQRAELEQSALAAMIASSEYQERSAAVAQRKEEIDVAGRRARSPEAVTKLNKRIGDFNKDLAALNALQATINAASASSNERIAAHNAAIAAHNTANMAFNTRLAEHEAKVKELNELIARLRSRCGAARQG